MTAATGHDAAAVWLAILAAAVGTYALRLSFIALLGRVSGVPPAVAGVLRFVPAAVLSALVVPAVFALQVGHGGGLGVAAVPVEVVAGAVAAVVAWRTGSVLATIGVGMAALWALTLLA